jgi:hypothetical protein
LFCSDGTKFLALQNLDKKANFEQNIRAMWNQVILYTLPSIIVFLTAYLMMRAYLQKETAQQRLQLTLENNKIITPIRLQAYERLVLLMERITPQSLIPRVYQKDMTAEQLHLMLLSQIRKEYEHNISQQIYVSPEAWESVKTAKESIVKLINTVASNPNATKSAQEMSKIIIETYASVEETPTEIAINKLKDEVSQFFG